MNYYQQQAEYESRLKVLRMKRDLGNYEDQLRKFKEEVDVNKRAEFDEEQIVDDEALDNNKSRNEKQQQ
jgi:hypothetical protein